MADRYGSGNKAGSRTGGNKTSGNKANGGYDDFLRDLKSGSFGNVVFLFGEENLLIKWACNSIIDRFVSKEDRKFAVEEYRADEINVDKIEESYATYSMFASKRIATVVDFKPLYKSGPDALSKEDAQRLIDLAEEARDGENGSMVIFTLDSRLCPSLKAFGENFAKASDSYFFPRLNRKMLEAFIRNRIHGAGKLVSEPQVGMMIDLSGYLDKDSEYDLEMFENDLLKIADASEGEVIENPVIEDILLGDENKSLFDCMDALLRGDKETAMTLLLNILKRSDPMMAAGFFRQQFEIIYNAKELSEDGVSLKKIAPLIGKNAYRVEKAYYSSRKFSKDDIARALIRLYNIERDVKRGDMKADTALELFVASL